ncbi:GNAT family N-acetyltransferase [Streptomyces seoulensis]|uniref:GNAT family N-acetyltransferase n=1 Tax=Streptomyces seoulensis TaxID=73044 RepID=UPI0036465504
MGEAREAPSGAYLGGIVVDPTRRRANVGTALTVARMRRVFGGPDEQLFYVANTRNRASIALHARLGFREITLFGADARNAPAQRPQRDSGNRR